MPVQPTAARAPAPSCSTMTDARKGARGGVKTLNFIDTQPLLRSPRACDPPEFVSADEG